MKFLIVGLGSMGKRRIRCLNHLGQNDVIGYDIRPDRNEEAEKLYGIKTQVSIEKSLEEQPAVMIISTPPDVHMHYARISIENNIPCFIEASVVEEDMDEVSQLAKEKNIFIAPSCTMRYHPQIRKIKEIIESNELGKPLLVNHYFGQNLNYWHPYESIKDFYVSKKETGGCREIVPFDLVYITWWFGYPESVTAFKSKISSIDADIDDIYQLLIEFPEGVKCTFTIDVFSKVSYRETKIVFENGNIEFDTVNNRLRVYHANSDKWQEIDSNFDEIYDKEEMYIRELESFLEGLKSPENYPYNLEEDHRILKILYNAEKSYELKKIMDC